MTEAPDQRRVRRSARQIGVWTGVASAVILAAGVGILVTVILVTARPAIRPDPDAPPPGSGRPSFDHIVVDVDRVLPWVVGLGIAGVLLLGLVAWAAARQSVRPLGAALRAQRNFVADASHELRTPLTALTSRVQILQRRHARGEPIDETLARLRSDLSTMDDILTELLMAAQADDAPGQQGAADVAPAVDAAIGTLRPLAQAADVRIERTVPDGLTAALPAVTLTRLCVALIDNAVQHSRPGTAVAVTAAHVGRAVEVRVADHGPGVRPEDGARIFERFARGPDTGRRRGFGLGLALVRDVAVRYGGSIRIESTSAEGTTFLLTLPAAR